MNLNEKKLEKDRKQDYIRKEPHDGECSCSLHKYDE